MKRLNLIVACLFLALAAGSASGAEDSTLHITGAAGVSALYDSNFEAVWSLPDRFEPKDDFIYEADAKLGLSFSAGRFWQMALDLQGLANRPDYHSNDSWYVAKGTLYNGFSFGANTISLLDNLRYFTMPEVENYELIRNVATLIVKRILSRRWTGSLGFEDIQNHFPDDKYFDYNMNGGFVEVRNTWTPLVSTYYSVDNLWYLGGFDDRHENRVSSPESGYRLTGEVGFDAIFAKIHTLKVSYAYQIDRSTKRDPYEYTETPPNVTTQQILLEQSQERPPPHNPRDPHQPTPPPPSQNTPTEIGQFAVGEASSLDSDAQFNYNKHKATLLYSVRLTKGCSLSFYNEYIYKTLLDQDRVTLMNEKEWTDRLLLTSAWLTTRVYSDLYMKARYVFRMNDSSLNERDFEDHIVSLGLEYRF